MTDATFQKDLGHLTWDEVLRRQQDRASLVPAWLQALDLRPGITVLDVGAGPGYVTEQVARCVGSTGLVLALDRAPETFAYLERLRSDAGLAWIRPLIADVTAMDLRDQRIDAALVTMMLHHADDPLGLLRAVAGWLAPGVRAVVAEFDPNGPCTSGPPREHRIAPGQVQGWCEQVGLGCLAVQQQTDEHYMLLVERVGKREPWLDVASTGCALTPCAVSSDAKPGAVEDSEGGVHVRAMMVTGPRARREPDCARCRPSAPRAHFGRSDLKSGGSQASGRAPVRTRRRLNSPWTSQVGPK